MDFIRNDPFSIRFFFSRIWKFILDKINIFIQDKLTGRTSYNALIKYRDNIRNFLYLVLFFLSVFCLFLSALICIDSYYPYLPRSSRAENTLSGIYTVIFVVSVYKGMRNIDFCFFRFSCSVMLATPGFFFFNKENNLYYTSTVISLLTFLISESIHSIGNLRKFYIASSIIFWLPGIFQNDFKFSNGIIDTSLPSRIFITCWLGSSLFFYVKGSYIKNNFYSCCLILILWLGINDTTDRLNILILILVILQHLSKFLFSGNIEFLIFLFKIILNVFGVKINFCSIYNEGIIKTKTIFTNKREYLIFKKDFLQCKNDNNYKLNKAKDDEYYEIELSGEVIEKLDIGDCFLANNKILIKGEKKAKKLFYSIKNNIDFADPCLGKSIWHCKGFEEILYTADIENYELVSLPHFIYLGAWRLEIPETLKGINKLFFLHQYKCFKKIYSDLSFVLMKCPLSFKSKIGNKKYKNFVSDIGKIKDLGFKMGIPERKLNRSVDIDWTKSQEIEVRYTKGQRIKIFNEEEDISDLSTNILKIEFKGKNKPIKEENDNNEGGLGKNKEGEEDKNKNNENIKNNNSSLGLKDIKEMLHIECYYKIVREEKKIRLLSPESLEPKEFNIPDRVNNTNFPKIRRFKRFKILFREKFKPKKYFKFKTRLENFKPESFEDTQKRMGRKRKMPEFSLERLIDKSNVSELNKRRRGNDIIVKKESILKFPKAKVEDFDFLLNENLKSIKSEEGRKKYSEIVKTLSNQNLARNVGDVMVYSYHSLVKRSEDLFKRFEKNKISRDTAMLISEGIRNEINAKCMKENMKKVLEIEEEDENEWVEILGKKRKIELDVVQDPVKVKNRFDVLRDLEENDKESFNIIEKELSKLIDEKERTNRDVLNKEAWIRENNKKKKEEGKISGKPYQGSKRRAGSKDLIFKGKFKWMKMTSPLKKEIIKTMLNGESRNNLKISISTNCKDEQEKGRDENEKTIKASEIITRNFWESTKSECKMLIKSLVKDKKGMVKNKKSNEDIDDLKVINNHAYFFNEMNKDFYNVKGSKEKYIGCVKEYYEKILEIEERMDNISHC